MHRYNALILAAAGAWLYFTGWAYLYSYYSYFQISLIEISPSVQFVFMHSLTPWYFAATRITLGEVILFIGIYLILVVMLRGILASRRVNSIVGSLTNGLFLGIMVIATVFLASLFVARWAGKERAIQTWANPPMIAFFKFKDDSYGKTNDLFYKLTELNDDLALRYLFSTGEIHYAFYRKPSCTNPYCGLVFKIPVDLANEIVIIGR